MTKKDLINNCIDMSYEISIENLQNAIKEVTGYRYMQTKYSVKLWRELHDKLKTLVGTGKSGNIRLFLGTNVEHYRQ